MTPEEAIKTVHCCMHIGDDIILQARDMAIIALEKQIPKKPVEREIDTCLSEMPTKTLSCPNCNKQIVNVWNKDGYNPNFCHYCGQALDWSRRRYHYD